MHVEQDEFTVTYDPSRIDEKALISAVKKTGYRAESVVGPNAALDEQVIEILGEPDEPPFFTEAFEKAKAHGKPLFLDFTASWCEPCQRMKRETFRDKAVTSLLDRYVLVEIDTDVYPALAKRFEVVGLPDIRLMSPDQAHERKILGFQSARDFAAILGSFLETYSQRP